MAEPIPFIADVLNECERSIRTIQPKRNEYLIRAGDVESNIYWVDSGAIRAVYVTAEEEHSIRFGYEGSFINALPSYFTAQPSEFYLQALRETQVRAIPKKALYEFIDSSTSRQVAYRSLLEQLAVQQMERELDLLEPTPLERLKRVFKRSPQVFQEVPAKYIAAYLRMTPETLSRLRKELNY